MALTRTEICFKDRASYLITYLNHMQMITQINGCIYYEWKIFLKVAVLQQTAASRMRVYYMHPKIAGFDGISDVISLCCAQLKPRNVTRDSAAEV